MQDLDFYGLLSLAAFEWHDRQKARVERRRRMNERKLAYQRDHRPSGKSDRSNLHDKARDLARLDQDALRCDMDEWLSPVYDWDDSHLDEWSAEIIQENWTTKHFYSLVDCLRYVDHAFEEDPNETLWKDEFILEIADHLDCLVARDRRQLQLLTIEQERLYELVFDLRRDILFGDDDIDFLLGYGYDRDEDWALPPGDLHWADRYDDYVGHI